MNRFAAILFLTLAVAACRDRQSVVPAVTAPSPLPLSPVALISGFVVDTASRPLAGATVDVVDGSPQAGTSTTSDANGQFSLTGAFVETSTFRATKEGYVAATQAWSCNSPGTGICPGRSRPWLGFYLAVLAPPVNIAGDYTLTFIADTADARCADLPNELRTRTYAATITPGSRPNIPNIPANTLFDVRVSGATFLVSNNGFYIGVAGDYLGIVLGGDGPGLVEQVAPNTYLAFGGSAAASVGTSAVSTISTSFSGVIEHCELISGRFYDCSPSQPVAHATQCGSKNHRLILTRR
jgi:hypothetical protein